MNTAKSPSGWWISQLNYEDILFRDKLRVDLATFLRQRNVQESRIVGSGMDYLVMCAMRLLREERNPGSHEGTRHVIQPDGSCSCGFGWEMEMSL